MTSWNLETKIQEPVQISFPDFLDKLKKIVANVREGYKVSWQRAGVSPLK